MRGATALQAIATSGTEILGWSNNRVRQLVATAAGAGAEVDGVVVGYVAGTRTLGVEVEQDNGTDVAGTTVLPLVTATNAGLLPTTGRICPDPSTGTAGQVCTVNAAEDGYELAGGAAGGATDRIVLADAVGVSNTAGPHEITLTEAMVARQIVTFHIVTSGATNPDAIGYLLSDDILLLDPEATAPSDAENGLPLTTTNYTQTSITSQGGNYFVFRKDDSTLWVRPTRLLAHSLTITATPLGGALSTSAQQELVNESRLVDTEIITSTQALSTTATSTPMDSVPRDTFNFTTIPIEDFERIDLGLELDGTFDFVVPIRISRQMMLDIPTTPADLYPDGGTTQRRLEAVYWSGRVSAGINSEIGTAVTRPIFTWVDSRRNNGLESLSVAFTKNVDGDISQMHTYASSDVTMRLRYAVIRHYED